MRILAWVFTLTIALSPSFPPAFAQLNSQFWQGNMETGIEALGEGDYAKAINFLNKATKIAEGFAGNERVALANSLRWLAEAYLLQGQHLKAEQAATRALKITGELTEPIPSEVAEVQIVAAKVYRTQARFADAEMLLQKALTIMEAEYGPMGGDSDS